VRFRQVFLWSLFPGLKESPVVPLAESELLAEILEEARKAIGVTFPQDKR
jgi:dihydrodiol dehydrogenase / D-xylose 1-dehydrogenase (NADP)